MADFTSLFRFATTTDIILLVVGTICAIAMGVALPSFAILWGNMTNKFGDGGSIEDAAKDIMLSFIYIGLGAFAAGWGMFACWMIAGERQSIACRKEYLRSLLRQEIGWFDTINQSELATKFATDCFAFQGAIGEKVSTLIMTISMFAAGFIIAFIYGWLMTLVIACSLPVIGLGGFLFMSASAKKDKEQETEYAEAGGQVEQAISSIKTVKQLNGE
jgi:ATP-binding cassette subfamily B (MDR/TAP) protein 1